MHSISARTDTRMIGLRFRASGRLRRCSPDVRSGLKNEPATRPLAGHTIAVYEPDARLSMVWPVPEDDDWLDRSRDDGIPEWAETDGHEWKHVRTGHVVVLLGGAPIWQERVWYLDWGSGTAATSQTSSRSSATRRRVRTPKSSAGRRALGP